MWLAQTRCEKHERAADIDGTARHILTVMASFCRNDPPACFAGLGTIAKRSGFKVSTVQRAQKRLAAMGLIERIDGPEVSVRWRLSVLANTEGVPEVSEPATDLPEQALSVNLTNNPQESIVGQSDQSIVGQSDQTPGQSDLHIKESSRDKRRDDDDTVAPARARPDGRARSAPSTAANDEALIAEFAPEVAEKLNGSHEDAVLWLTEKLGKAKATARIGRRAFVRRCIDNHEVAAKSPRNGAAVSRTATSSRRGKAAKKRPARVRLHLVPYPDGGEPRIETRSATGDLRVFNEHAERRADRWSRVAGRKLAVGVVVEMGHQGKADSWQLYRVERVESA